MESFLISLLAGAGALTLFALARAASSRRSAKEPAGAGPATTNPQDAAAVAAGPTRSEAEEASENGRAELRPAHLGDDEESREPPGSEVFGFRPGQGYSRDQLTAALQALDIAAGVVGIGSAEVDQIIIPRWKAEGKSRPVFEVLRDVADERAAERGQPREPVRSTGSTRWRVGLISGAVLILALSILAQGCFPRYELQGRYTLDRWTGELCDRSRCWDPRR